MTTYEKTTAALLLWGKNTLLQNDVAIECTFPVRVRYIACTGQTTAGHSAHIVISVMFSTQYTI